MTLKSTLSLSVMTGFLLLIGCSGADTYEIAPVDAIWLTEQIEAERLERQNKDSRLEALQNLDLAEPGLFSWDEKNETGQNVEFINLELPDDGGEIGKLVLSGLHMKEGSPLYTSLQIEDAVFTAYQGQEFARLKKARLNFSPELNTHILNSKLLRTGTLNNK